MSVVVAGGISVRYPRRTKMVRGRRNTPCVLVNCAGCPIPILNHLTLILKNGTFNR